MQQKRAIANRSLVKGPSAADRGPPPMTSGRLLDRKPRRDAVAIFGFAREQNDRALVDRRFERSDQMIGLDLKRISNFFGPSWIVTLMALSLADSGLP